MKQEDIDVFEKLTVQLTSTYDELTLLSKKNPRDAVNKFKLKFINALLVRANEFLGSKYRPFEDFSTLEEDDVPQNSDAVFILSQYIECFEKYRADNVTREYGKWYWQVESKKGQNEKGPETVMPRKLRS